MSDGSFGESQAQFKGTGAKPTGHPLIHWLGALASVGVLGVMVYWGLQLVQRDPNEVPVIKAMEGPARILPDDPGGAQTSYTGLAVNTVQSEGEAEKPSDRVVLAPPPQVLLPEDVAVPKLAEVVRPPEKPVEELILESVEDAVGDGRSEPTGTPDAVADLIDLEDRLDDDRPVTLTVTDVPEGMTIDASGATPKLVADDAAAVAPAVPPTGTRYAPKTSLWPLPRAKSVRLATADTGRRTDANAPTPLSREVPDVPLGTRLIQLGAFDSRETALGEWVRIAGEHHDLLGNKSFLIQLAEAGGRQFYRLRAVGFADTTESKAMCSALVQRGAQCIPVVAR